MFPQNHESSAAAESDGRVTGEAVENPERPVEKRYPLSRFARTAVFASTIIGGILGYLIAFSVFDIACARSGCGTIVPLLWGIAGALIGMVGCAVVAVLLSRSFAEWSMIRAEGGDETSQSRGPKTC